MYAPRHEKPRPEFAKVGLGRPAATPEIAKRHMEQGFLLFQGPTDLGLMAAGARRYLDNVGQTSRSAWVLQDPPAAPPEGT